MSSYLHFAAQPVFITEALLACPLEVSVSRSQSPGKEVGYTCQSIVYEKTDKLFKLTLTPACDIYQLTQPACLCTDGGNQSISTGIKTPVSRLLPTQSLLSMRPDHKGSNY